MEDIISDDTAMLSSLTEVLELISSVLTAGPNYHIRTRGNVKMSMYVSSPCFLSSKTESSCIYFYGDAWPSLECEPIGGASYIDELVVSISWFKLDRAAPVLNISLLRSKNTQKHNHTEGCRR